MKRALFLATSLCILTPQFLAAQSTAEARFAKAVLQQIQGISFRKNREYCGYIGYDANGVLFASNARKGRMNECTGAAPDNMDIVASYHTHGAFDRNVPAEFPSATDLEGDEAEGIDGYIATPGGRLWYSDSTDMIVSQICGIGCLKQDPRFVAGLDGKIHVSYSYRQLLDIGGE